MAEYNELYQQVILEHNKKPRNFAVSGESRVRVCPDSETNSIEMMFGHGSAVVTKPR